MSALADAVMTKQHKTPASNTISFFDNEITSLVFDMKPNVTMPLIYRHLNLPMYLIVDKTRIAKHMAARLTCNSPYVARAA